MMKKNHRTNLLSENACPRCSKPFMYGYGKLPKNLIGFVSSECTSNTLESCHDFCAMVW